MVTRSTRNLRSLTNMELTKYIDTYENFPKKGINFKDISPLLADPAALNQLVHEMSGMSYGYNFDLVVGLDSRGFIFGSALAFSRHKGFVMARKAKKLPGLVTSADYSLEYGEASLEVQVDRVRGKKVLIVDDVLATGGTINAAIEAVTKAGGTVTGVITVIELTSLNGRSTFKGKIGYNSLIKC